MKLARNILIAGMLLSASVQAQTPVPEGAEFQVNTYTTSHQGYATVAASDGGHFVVAWESKGSYGSDSSGYSIQGQRYSTLTIYNNDFEDGSFGDWTVVPPPVP